MRIKFVADDYGKTPEDNSAIECLLASGLMSGISVIPGAKFAVKSRWTARDSARWGAHLFLTEFGPFTKKISATFGGKGVGKITLFRNLCNGRISVEDIEEEFEAQLDRLSSDGFDVKFIDSHMNVHWLPQVFEAVKRLALKRGLFHELRPFAQLDFTLRWDLRSWFYSKRAEKLNFKANSRVLVNCPGYAVDDLDLPASLRKWDKFLSSVPPLGYDEILVPCHPGISPAEIKLYSAPEFKQLLGKHGVL